MTDSRERYQGFNIRQLMATVACMALLFGCLAWVERSGVWYSVTQAFQSSLYFYPGFAWAAGASLIIAVIAAACDRRVWRFRSLWMLLPIAVPMALLVFGEAFRRGNGDPPQTTIDPQYIVEVFPWLHLPIGIILMGCFRSVTKWTIIAGITTVAVWLSFGAQISSWMCVTNIWL